MAAKKYRLKIEQGTNYRKPFVMKRDGTPVNFTGCTARMQVRESVDSADILLELTTENGGIEIEGAEGKVTLVFKPDDTVDKAWRMGVYDVEITDSNGDVTRFLQGVITVSPEVTR